jgi:hypothetical protein
LQADLPTVLPDKRQEVFVYDIEFLPCLGDSLQGLRGDGNAVGLDKLGDLDKGVPDSLLLADGTYQFHDAVTQTLLVVDEMRHYEFELVAVVDG